MIHLIHNLLHLYRSQYWPRQKIEHSQRELAMNVLQIAHRDVPMYRTLYGSEGFAGDIARDFQLFSSLPVVSKGLLKASFPDRIVSRHVDPGRLYPVATSGTTDRVMLFHDEHKRDWDRAADWLLEFQGNRFRPGRRQLVIPPDACYERCGADEYGRVETVVSRMTALVRARRGQRAAALRSLRAQIFRDWVWRQRFLKAFGPDGTAVGSDALDTYVQEIRAWHPGVVSSLPMFLFILARHLENRGGSNGARLASLIRPSGGRITPQMARAIESTFGGLVRENFGTAELGTVAHDCENTRRQHLFSELFYLEFVRGGRQVGPGELGEILVTDLRNRVCPLIRYQVGDVGTYEEGQCRCGRTGLLFTVHSRLSEVIVTPAGRAFAGDEVVDFFLGRPAFQYARVTQEAPDRFLLEFVLRAGGHEGSSAEVLSRDFSRFLDYPVTVRPRPIKSLIPERSGKYTYVVSRSFQDFHNAPKVKSEATRPSTQHRSVQVPR